MRAVFNCCASGRCRRCKIVVTQSHRNVSNRADCKTAKLRFRLRVTPNVDYAFKKSLYSVLNSDYFSSIASGSGILFHRASACRRPSSRFRKTRQTSLDSVLRLLPQRKEQSGRREYRRCENSSRPSERPTFLAKDPKSHQ